MSTRSRYCRCCRSRHARAETGLKNTVRLIESPNFIFPEGGIPPSDELLDHYLEFDESWSHLAGLMGQFQIALVVWNTTMGPDPSDLIIPDQPDYSKLPEDFFLATKQAMADLGQRLLQFWEELSRKFKCDFSAASYGDLIDPKVTETISKTKLELLQKLYPTKGLDKFTHRADLFDMLSEFIDNHLLDDIDLEKYFQEDNFE
jgi:hypothetical protein